VAANYRIQVVIATLTPSGSTIVVQVPTFVYEGEVLGIVSIEHAEKIARLTFEQLLPNAGVSVCAVYV
jgi:hypothetical protein